MAKKTKEQVRKRMLAELRKEPKVKPVVFKNDPFNKELAGFELQEK